MSNTHRFYIVEEDHEWICYPICCIEQNKYLYAKLAHGNNSRSVHLRISQNARATLWLQKPKLRKSSLPNHYLKQAYHYIKANATSKQRVLVKLVEILNLQIGPYIIFELPENGIAIWIRFPQGFDLTFALQNIRNVGIRFYVPNLEKRNTVNLHYMRLDISKFDESECRKTAIKLKNLLTKLAK